MNGEDLWRRSRQPLVRHKEATVSRHIFFLVKIFGKEQYAVDFVSGKLFCNRLSSFRGFEESGISNRGDGDEGVAGWYQPDQARFTINDIVMEGLAAPVSVSFNRHGHLNLFCMYAAHSGDFQTVSEESLEDFKRHLQIPGGCADLGRFAVVVTNTPEFIKRVRAAVQKNNFELRARLVKYYDPNTFSGSFPEDYVGFMKRDEYQDQGEYRFLINTKTKGSDPVILDIGDIDDITTGCSTTNINSLLDVRLRNDTA